MFIPRGFKAALVIFIGVFALILSFSCKSDSPTDSGNQSPVLPSSPTPADEAVEIAVTPTLSWECFDPDGDPIVYDIYFDTSANPVLVAQSWPNRTYQPGSALSLGTTYYWKIVPRDIYDNETEGDIWQFTTFANRAPNQPSHPSPVDDAERVSNEISLSWVCSDYENDSIYYDIYFDTLYPPALYVSHHDTTLYSIPDTLDNQTTYFWQIVAIDTAGNETSGPVWSFTTEKGPGLYFIKQVPTAGTTLDIYVIRDELYVAEGSGGFQIFDISTPSVPIELGHYQYLNVYAEDIVVFGNYAYVADANHGLHIVDISNPYQPITEALVVLPFHAHALSLIDNTVYVACDTAGLYVIYVEFPGLPEIIGSLSFLNKPSCSISIFDHYAVMGALNRGLFVVDISDIDSLEIIGQYDTPGLVENVVTEITDAGIYGYVADGSNGYHIINLSIPANPIQQAYRAFVDYVYDVAIDDDYAYLAVNHQGLYILDKDNPLNIIETYDTSGQARAILLAGTYIYIADGTDGVQILEFID